jgi:hypothetical protein
MTAVTYPINNSPLIVGLLIWLCFFGATSLHAHSGRTDSRGGHNVTADGSYHYHSSPAKKEELFRAYAPRKTSESKPITSKDVQVILACIVILGPMAYIFSIYFYE